MSDDFKSILKLDTEPISVRLLADESTAKTSIIKKKINVCQMVANARHLGQTSTGVPRNMICALGAAALGLIATPPAMVDGRAAVNKYTKDQEAGRKFFQNTYKMGDKGKLVEAVETGPLYDHEDCDVFVIYANAAQMLGLIHANSYLAGEKTTADTVAEGALCSAIGYAMDCQKPIVGFPCAGDRRFASTQHSELVFAAPAKDLEKIHSSLVELRKLGPIFPVPPQVNFEPLMPVYYTIQESDLK